MEKVPPGLLLVYYLNNSISLFKNRTLHDASIYFHVRGVVEYKKKTFLEQPG